MNEITTGRLALRVARHADRLVHVVQAADPSLLLKQIKGGEAREIDLLVEDQCPIPPEMKDAPVMDG